MRRITVLIATLAIVLLPAVTSAQTDQMMTGHLLGFATATKDEGGEMKQISINLVCKQDGTDVSCVTPGGDYKWKGTYTNQHLELGIETNGEFMKLSGDAVTLTKTVTTFKGTMIGKYRRLLFWYNVEGIWEGSVS